MTGGVWLLGANKCGHRSFVGADSTKQGTVPERRECRARSASGIESTSWMSVSGASLSCW